MKRSILEPWMNTWYPREGWMEVSCPYPDEPYPAGVEFDNTFCVGCEDAIGPRLVEDADGYDRGVWSSVWTHSKVDGFLCEDCCVDAEEGLLGTWDW